MCGRVLLTRQVKSMSAQHPARLCRTVKQCRRCPQVWVVVSEYWQNLTDANTSCRTGNPKDRPLFTQTKFWNKWKLNPSSNTWKRRWDSLWFEGRGWRKDDLKRKKPPEDNSLRFQVNTRGTRLCYSCLWPVCVCALPSNTPDEETAATCALFPLSHLLETFQMSVQSELFCYYYFFLYNQEQTYIKFDWGKTRLNGRRRKRAILAEEGFCEGWNLLLPVWLVPNLCAAVFTFGVVPPMARERTWTWRFRFSTIWPPFSVVYRRTVLSSRNSSSGCFHQSGSTP